MLGSHPSSPPPTHRCKNITWPQTSFAGGNNIPEILMVERENKLNWTWMCPSRSTRITPYIVEPAATYQEGHPAYVVITGRNEVVAKVMFLLVSVILLTGGGGMSEADPPPGADTPRVRPPRSRHTPREQTPPGTKYTPPEADSGIRSTSGRYASYWNAFLCLFLSS